MTIRRDVTVEGVRHAPGNVLRGASAAIREWSGHEPTRAPPRVHEHDVARSHLDRVGKQAALALASTSPEHWGNVIRELQIAHSAYLHAGGEMLT